MARHRFRFPQPRKADMQLIRAAAEGDLDACLAAIDEGARVDAVSHTYQTPLGMACRSNSVDIVRMLLENGANPNLLEGGKTPLMEAAYRGNREIIDLLIEAGANLEAKLEVAHRVFMDVPQFALEGGHRRLAIELRSLINQQKRAGDGVRLRLREIAEQLDLDEKGRPRGEAL